MQKVFVFLLLVIATIFNSLMAQKGHDVVVYGGTPSGVIAAVAASRQGAKVLLIEQTKHVGGLNTSGIGTAETEHMIEETISGLPLEFYSRLGKYYGLNKPAYYFESHVAEKVFNDMLKEANVKVLFEAYVDKVNKKEDAIQSIYLTNGSLIRGDVFIDATYEGDLMARAGISYTYGRESKEQYNESLAGIRLLDKPIDVSPYDDNGRLLPGFVDANTMVNGEASKRVMNYNFRLMVSTNDDRIPFPAPQHYDPQRFLLLKRLLEKHPETKLLDIIDIYHWSIYLKGKYEINNKQNALISLGLFGGNIDYPDAGYKKRAAIYQDHKDWTLGLFYFLLNDPSVPEALRKETNQYGLAPDEFIDNNHFPYYLYVREARRMIGSYVQTQKDIFTDTKKNDAIALGSHFVDCHHVQRVAISKNQFMNEGRIWEKVDQPYEISYRIITPKINECKNLLVPVAVSASHVAFCSIRVEVTWMQLGQAAGIAAAIAAQKKIPVQDINIRYLQNQLKADGVILSTDHQKWETNDSK
jgi:hypothetical protein